LGESLIRQTGRPAGFKPFHLVVAAVIAVVWVGLAAFALTHGRGAQSSVDVYSELPADLTFQLQAKGVQYQGVSSVDAGTTQAVLSHVGGSGVTAGSGVLVVRTSFTDNAQAAGKGGKTYTDQPALMVVAPQTTGSSVFVAFVDPTSYQVLTSLTYTSSAVSPSPSPSSSAAG
jgi:hypothetical protein